MSWALSQDPGSAARKLLLVVLGNYADPDGVTFVGQDQLAEACCCSDRAIRSGLAALEAAGVIARFRRVRPNGSRTSDWTVLAPRSKNRGAMVDAVTDSAHRPPHVAEAARRGASGPEDSSGRTAPNRKSCVGSTGSQLPVHTRQGTLECSGESILSGRARENGGSPRRRVTFRRKPVPPPIIDAAECVLREFNKAFGRRVGAWSGDGSPSSALRQIIGAMVERPGVTPDEWREGVRRVRENPPPWVDGGADGVALGDVFGPRAAERTLSNPGRRAVRRSGKDPAKQERVDRFLAALDSFTNGGS